MSESTLKFSRLFGNKWWDSVCVTRKLRHLRILRGWSFAGFARCRCHLKWRHPTFLRIAVSQDLLFPFLLTFFVSVPVIAVVQTLRCFLQCKDVVLPIASDDDFDDFLHLLCTSLAVGHWPSLLPDLVIAWHFPFETKTFSRGVKAAATVQRPQRLSFPFHYLPIPSHQGTWKKLPKLKQNLPGALQRKGRGWPAANAQRFLLSWPRWKTHNLQQTPTGRCYSLLSSTIALTCPPSKLSIRQLWQWQRCKVRKVTQTRRKGKGKGEGEGERKGDNKH